MIISHINEIKHITLYPLAQSPSLLSWPDEQKEEIQPILSINQDFYFREENNEDLMKLIICKPNISEKLRELQYDYVSKVLE